MESTIPVDNGTVYRSTEINEIMGALSKAQGNYKHLVANQESQGKKFANLQAILLAVRESLSTNGLGFFQFIELLDEGSGAALLKTTIGHSSGQWITSCTRVVAGKTDKQTGRTYEVHKRLHALMLLGIAPSDNDPISLDDDGDLMAERQLIEELRKPDSPKKPEVDYNDVISNDQYEELLIELDFSDGKRIAKQIMDTHDIETLADLPRSQYHHARSQILKIKKTVSEPNSSRTR